MLEYFLNFQIMAYPSIPLLDEGYDNHYPQIHSHRDRMYQKSLNTIEEVSI
jgi:hypothetical protein